MHIVQILIEIRDSALSEQDKGRKFERLIQSWFRADPLYAEELVQVWLWEQFPARDQFGTHDLGIDLVARTKLGEYWAIQCKFYGDNTAIDKAAVDSFISNSSRSFTDPVTGNETAFSARYWVSTNDYFNANAEEIIKHQVIPFQRITLENLAQSPVDWEALYKGTPENRVKKSLFPHQQQALENARAYFAENDRGKLIMACGSGKTLTSLKIAEDMVKPKGSVLFLLPSISLVNQTLNSWMSDADTLIKPICICSDAKASRKKTEDSASDDLVDLALPATTNPNEIARRYRAYAKMLEKEPAGLLLIFSTYQSIDAVADAQKAISEKMGKQHCFDLIICDEAHRTTGVIKPSEGQSDFTKVHKNEFICAKKRLYMTATPRLYADNVKARARQSDYELCSMDDKSLYGEEFYRVSFGYAVANGLLTDYKVLVLTVGSEYQLPEELRELVRDKNNKELNFDLASRLVGCINGLAKNTTDADNQIVWQSDPRIMKRAIAFCPNIDKKGDPGSSKNTTKTLPLIGSQLGVDSEHKISIDARHIDGSMDSGQRAKLMGWLSEENSNPDECRVLCNVRCLSEGIDVPALDAAIFLSPRNSQVEVVQSVGRVMRNFHKGHADEKKFGYIIIPVVVNPNVSAEEALNDNKSFAVAWDVLNALRAHDERFNAMINSIALNKTKPVDKVMVDYTKFYKDDVTAGGEDVLSSEEAERLREMQAGISTQMSLMEEIDEKLYAKMVEKVGSRLYWERWARDIAPLARNLIARIKELIAMPGDLQKSFTAFVKALRASINDSITETQAIEMLGQHLITRPVFEALFREYNFDENNAVSRAMRAMADKLEDHGLAKDTAILHDFYESVKLNLGTVNTLSGKQTVIKNLYDSFFRGAFPLAVEQLGIVYTPMECVDFILRSVDAALKNEFALGLTDKGVHILDPFTGTGTFITRLLQSGLIKREDLERKYRHEIHCNEIVLLAYYVADVNIESVFHDLVENKTYQPFNGICLTDTFALSAMESQPELYPFLYENFKSMEDEAKAPIRVIIGNPPYSAGQKSGNDNAQNLKYPALDKRIEETYVSAVHATNKNSLYDSYIRAFRWATDRLKQNNEGGVIGFITNGGWLDGNAAAGFRKCLEREFTSIYVFHLRGDQRTSGELSKKEGGKIFGSGSRAPVVITILVYNPAKQPPAQIHYCDIGDYLSREQKLKILSVRASIFDRKIKWQEISPDEHGDWLKQRSDLFGGFIAIGDKHDKKNKETFFEPVYSTGVQTNRDAWVYNYAQIQLENNIKRTIEFYNSQCEASKNGHPLSLDPKFFSWTDVTRDKAQKGIRFSFGNGRITEAIYRPFSERFMYFSPELNHRPGNMPYLFPTAKSENLVICVNGTGGKKDFSCLMTDRIPDLEIIEKSQCFPLYYYQQNKAVQDDLLGNDTSYERKYAITDWILSNIRGRFGNARSITKESIFYYVYGILHSPEYRSRFVDDLKKELPHIPIVEKVEDFIDFSEIGRQLAELHLNYEKAAHWQDVKVSGADKGNFHVDKMKFAGKQGAWDKSQIIYNSDITVSNIPLKAYEYVVNGRSAIEWIMESYRIKTDKDSGISNDPNDWAKEHGKPGYILDLLLSVIGLSMKTLELVEKLPKLEFE